MLRINIKYQISNIKYTNPKCKNIFIFLICVFDFWFLIFGFSDAYALNLDNLKVNFLKGDYKSAIYEGEKIISKTSGDTYNLDELYYILGLSYLKEGNYLRASDIFEIIIKEFPGSAFKDDALLGLGDAYFLSENYAKAQSYYKELTDSNPYTKLRAPVYYRLSQIEAKLGNILQAKEYLDKLRRDFPLSLESRMDKDLSSLSDFYYAVQVGSFVNLNNARGLCNKLIKQGYPASIQEVELDNKKIYRVKVGKFQSRSEAFQLENKLSSEGYPTKIVP